MILDFKTDLFRPAKSARKSAMVLLADCFTVKTSVLVHDRLIPYRNGKATAHNYVIPSIGCPSAVIPKCEQKPFKPARESALVFSQHITRLSLDWLYDNKTSPFVETTVKRVRLADGIRQTQAMRFTDFQTPYGNTRTSNTTRGFVAYAGLALDVKQSSDRIKPAMRLQLVRCPLPLFVQSKASTTPKQYWHTKLPANYYL